MPQIHLDPWQDIVNVHWSENYVPPPYIVVGHIFNQRSRASAIHYYDYGPEGTDFNTEQYHADLGEVTGFNIGYGSLESFTLAPPTTPYIVTGNAYSESGSFMFSTTLSCSSFPSGLELSWASGVFGIIFAKYVRVSPASFSAHPRATWQYNAGGTKFPFSGNLSPTIQAGSTQIAAGPDSFIHEEEGNNQGGSHLVYEAEIALNFNASPAWDGARSHYVDGGTASWAGATGTHTAKGTDYTYNLTGYATPLHPPAPEFTVCQIWFLFELSTHIGS